jgi:hypothetical protein
VSDFEAEYRKLCCPECQVFIPPDGDSLMYPHLPTCSRQPEIKAPLVPVPELDGWIRKRVPKGKP